MFCSVVCPMTDCFYRYLIVDWEQQNFSISACLFSENSQQNLVAIASASSSSGSGSSTVGIAVGVTVGVVVLIAAAIAAFFVIRRRKRRQTGANAKDREDPSEKIRQGFAKGELDTGHDNQRYEMAGSDPNQRKETDDEIPGWVNEKANYPGDRSGMVEADGDGSARAELGGPIAPRTTVRPLHEMHDPHSQPRFELPADTPGELQGSTPSSSVPASPVSSTRRSAGRLSGAGGLRSPFSKPTSPLSAPSGSPHPSPIDRRLGQTPPSAGPSSGPSRSSFLGFSRRGGNRSSPASGPSSEYSRDSRQAPQHPGQPSDSDRPMIPSSPHVPGRSSNMASSHSNRGREAFSPAVSRRGTFERSGTPSAPYPANDPDISSPISPQSPEAQQHQHQGLWGRLRRS